MTLARMFSMTPSGRGDLRSTILQAAAARRALATRPELTAFRIAHTGELALPGLALDRYGDFVVAHFSSPQASERAAEVARCLVELGALGVYGKFRPRQASTLADTRRDDVAPALPLAGQEAPSPMQIVEEGDPFLVRLNDGLSTGIFLDQRANRGLLRGASAGRRVLNLFAYACAFSVSAARGGASQVTSVDLSKQALAWGQENLALSGYTDPKRFRFIADEALTFLRRCAVRGDRYDLIALDPPSFATTRELRFTVEHDYRGLAAAALAVLAPGGQLLACTNHRGVPSARFLRFLEDAARASRRAPQRLELLPPPADFPEPPGTEPYLKAALLRVA
jgi:23S rRNA (cytosine1962-C5)-methyltransferase